MHAVVVDGLDPGGEHLVETSQPVDVVQGAGDSQLDEELFTNGAEEPFDLAPPGWLPGPRMDKPDSQDRQRPQQLFGDHGRPVVQIDDPGDPCLLYTSDAADDLLCVDLGGRRI